MEPPPPPHRGVMRHRQGLLARFAASLRNTFRRLARRPA
jgi:hypothetical protein